MGASFHFSSLAWECLGSVMWANVATSAYGTNSITVVITRQSQSLPRCSLITWKCSLFFPEQCFWCQLGGTSRQRLVETLCNVLLSADNNGGAKFSCPSFPFSSFFQFSTSTSKMECIHQRSGEKRHLVVSGVNCLLFSERCSYRWKIKSSQRWQFICSYRKNGGCASTSKGHGHFWAPAALFQWNMPAALICWAFVFNANKHADREASRGLLLPVCLSPCCCRL